MCLSLSAGGSALQDSAFGYFITACVVILLAIMSYLALPRMVRHHIQTEHCCTELDSFECFVFYHEVFSNVFPFCFH